MQRKTVQRNIIQDLIVNKPIHLSASDVYTMVKDQNISLATVYRTLNTLVDEKKIASFKANNEVIYDGSLHEHAHFICKTCGHIMDLDLNICDLKQNVENRLNCDVQSANITLSGICQTCQKLKEKN